MLRIIRERKGEKAIETARAVGLEQPQYWHIENGNRPVSADIAERLAGHFGVPVPLICSPKLYMLADASPAPTTPETTAPQPAGAAR